MIVSRRSRLRQVLSSSLFVHPLIGLVMAPFAARGSALVTAYFTGQELKHLLEFLLIDNPVHPGETFPRTSGMRFRYDPSRPMFDVVTAIELGDLDRGYNAVDIIGKDERLYSLACSLYVGKVLVAIPTFTKGKLPLVPKSKDGQSLKSKVEALDDPGHDTPDLLPPPGTTDKSSVATMAGNGAVREIKEWQAVMDYLRTLPVKNPGELRTVPVDDRAREVRAIRAGQFRDPKMGDDPAPAHRFHSGTTHGP